MVEMSGSGGLNAKSWTIRDANKVGLSFTSLSVLYLPSRVRSSKWLNP